MLKSLKLYLNKLLQSRMIRLCMVFGIVTFLSGFALKSSNTLVENWYYRVFYSGFRDFWDLAFSWVPFPLIYVWLVFLIFSIGFVTWHRSHRITKTLKWSVFLISVITFHVIWFYWSWAFNYHRISLAGRWRLQNPITELDFVNTLNLHTCLVEELRTDYTEEITAWNMDPLKMENNIRNLVNNFQKLHLFPQFMKLRCRILKPSGSLLIWATSGVYMPFVSESQVDNGLHKLSKPFTMAHEFAHGMGWTHEGDCNFIAYLACIQSSDPFIRYSAEINYWRYLLSNARKNHPELFKEIRNGMDSLVLKDLIEIDTANDRYPEILPNLRNWFYDWYLKKHGIQSGEKSYSELISMLINYQKSIN